MHEISKTRVLVRSLPRLRAPRNYFINDKISEKVKTKVRIKPVGFRPGMRLYPALGIVSAIATILLALVIFGDNLLTSTTPVALAPAVEAPSEALSVEQEVQRTTGETPSPTEAAPVLAMGAPAVSSPTPDIGALKTGPSENATPTTIYLYAYPPTSTPEHPFIILNDQTEIAVDACEKYYSTGANPTEAYLYHCPTPTRTPFSFLQGFSQTPTTTASATPSLTPNATPTPTPSILPGASEAPLPMLNAAVTREGGAPPELIQPVPQSDTGDLAPSAAEPAEEPETTPNMGFIRYIVLAAEISLAAIAIIAGVIAIILRIRAG
jgi:hypothetical protein